MILWSQEDGTVLATPQPAHALIAGQLMRALAERPEPFEAVCTAAAQHDCPWMGWEQAPEFDPATGLPRHFNALCGAEHVPMWEKGVEAAIANWGLWVGLLILMHGTHIYRMGILGNRMAPAPESLAAMEGYMRREKAWSLELMARLGVSEAQVRPQQHKLAMVDSIALGLCWGQPRFEASGGSSSACTGTTLIRTGAHTATLDPWPLAPHTLVVETEALRLPARFADAEAMAKGLAAAPREQLRFTLACDRPDQGEGRVARA